MAVGTIAKRLLGHDEFHRQDHRIFFLHIPKTAGTAFNEAFRPIVPAHRHFDHMEIRRTDFFSAIEDGLPFYTSGHLAYEISQDLIKRKDVYSITILREPVAQLVSHLKAIKSYAQPQHKAVRTLFSPFVTEIAFALHHTPLSDFKRLGAVLGLPGSQQLFDNVQTRYLSGDSNTDAVDARHLKQAIENLSRFNFVFTLDQMQDATTRLSRRFRGMRHVPRVNQAELAETVDVTDPDFVRLCRPLIEKDLALYDVAKKQFKHAWFEPFWRTLAKTRRRILGLG
jgi:hypothetical protein